MRVPGPAPFPACPVTHWLMWCCIEFAYLTQPEACAIFLSWELVGLWFYARWLMRRIPYEATGLP